MKEYLERLQKIQADLFGEFAVYIDTHVFEEGGTLIHIAVFDKHDDLKSFNISSGDTKEEIENTFYKLKKYIEYIKA